MNQNINLPAIIIADGFGVFLTVMMLAAKIWRNDQNQKERNYIKAMLYTSMLSCIADTITFAFDGKPGVLAYYIVYVTNFWLYLSNVVMGSLWVLMLIAHISHNNLSTRQKILTIAVDTFGVLALIVNIFYPIIFTINESNQYARGKFYWIYLFIEIAFVIDGVGVYFFNKKRSEKAIYFPVWQYIIPIVAGILIQTFIYGVSTIWPAITIAVCGVIMGLYNENGEETQALRQHKIDSQIILEQKNQLETQQAKLEEALELSQAASVAKTTFLNNMSHDIRTPMNAMKGFIAMAKKYQDDKEKVNDYLDKMDIAGEQLLELINEVLEMSRIESGKIEFDEEAFNVEEQFKTLVTVFEAQAHTKGLEFSSSLDIEHKNVISDKTRIGQISLNILGNSIKYTLEGGMVDYSIKEIPCDKDGYARFVFTVKDTGIGMSKEYLEKLFEPFTRERSSTVSKIQGTGLGMSIVKNLTELLGGTIKVESELGKGSKFNVTLDLKIDTDAHEKDEDELENGIIDFSGYRILLVEDNEMNREIARDILEEKDLLVDDAEDGSVAIRKLEQKGLGAYDVILMDIQMPVLNGYETTEKIRKMPGGKDIPIIALSANAFKEDREKSIATGMNAHISKPIEIDELFKTMNDILK